MEIIRQINVNSFFDEILRDLPCANLTQVYISGIFAKYKNSHFDLSKESLTFKYFNARDKKDFSTFQNIGDWIFFINSWAPQHASNKEYYDTLAQLSYYSCYKLINKQWKLFEELADQLIVLEEIVQNRLNNLSVRK